MHHYPDKYSHLESLIHSLNPKHKFLFLLGILIYISLVPVTGFVLLLWPLILYTVHKSTVPWRHIFKNSFIFLLFLVSIIFLPFDRALLVLVKSFTSVVCLVVFFSTTSFSSFMAVLEELRFPKVLRMLFSFFYRYIFIFSHNAHRIKHAHDSKCFEKRQELGFGHMVYSLIIKSYERAETVYLAMLSRGYDDRDTESVS